MMLNTFTGKWINTRLINNYFQTLVDSFFKILPMRENEETTLPTYLKHLQASMLGFRGLIEAIHYDSEYMQLLSVLQYFIDNPDCEIDEVRREVFGAINLCNRLSKRYSESKVIK